MAGDLSMNTASRQRPSMLWGAANRLIRVRLQNDTGVKEREAGLQPPLRFGYGHKCDVYGGPGPDVIFELEWVRGPLRLSTAYCINSAHGE